MDRRLFISKYFCWNSGYVFLLGSVARSYAFILVNNFTRISEYLREQSQNFDKNMELERQKETLREEVIKQEEKLRRSV